MKGKNCFFIGHRDTPDAVVPRLAAAIEQGITVYGVRTFIVGHYGAFDRMAAESVIAAKSHHKEITLQMLIPYHPAERPMLLPEGFDAMYYPFEEAVPKRLAIVKANRLMVDRCDVLIAYAAYPGNAKNLVDHARKREKQGNIHIISL